MALPFSHRTTSASPSLVSLGRRTHTQSFSRCSPSDTLSRDCPAPLLEDLHTHPQTLDQKLPRLSQMPFIASPAYMDASRTCIKRNMASQLNNCGCGTTGQTTCNPTLILMGASCSDHHALYARPVASPPKLPCMCHIGMLSTLRTLVDGSAGTILALVMGSSTQEKAKESPYLLQQHLVSHQAL